MNVFSLLFAALGFLSYCSGQFTAINYDLVDQYEFPDADKNSDEVPNIESRINLIFPGTKWCGAGDIADKYDDLGRFATTDKCCRDHDHCADIILGGKTRHNITNESFYTRLSCECDEVFRICLRDSKEAAGNSVGQVYFNTLSTQCFREDYPITGCKRNEGYFIKRCLEYTFDKSGKKRFQWFDVPKY